MDLFGQRIKTRSEAAKYFSQTNQTEDSRKLASNYRPVFLTCVACKLLEHIVCSNIISHLDERKLLSDKDHAFRKWHSRETQLTTVLNGLAKILDNNRW